MTLHPRASSQNLDTVLGKNFSVLDHGFIRVVDYMGDDAAIVQAARVSYGSGTKTVREDRGLIRYLMRHRHTTPFEMCEIKFHIKLPIFVARQWIRHRTANVNEYSARYSVLDKEFYIPQEEQIACQSMTNNQGRSETLSSSKAKEIQKMLYEHSELSYKKYEALLKSDPSLARELARMILPVNFYTQWYWKVDLHNLLHFCALRADVHAQYEIRVYAQTILHEIIKNWVPLVYEAFCDYRTNGVFLSAQMHTILKKLLAKEPISFESSGLSRREWDEFCTLFNLAEGSFY